MCVVRLKWIAVTAFLGLASCATLNEEECREGEWTNIGFRDGSYGRGPEFIDQHAKACSRYGVTVNQSKWEAGRQQGLPHYCTRSNVYREGARGRRLRPVCPVDQLESLEAANDRGLMWYRIGQDIADAERDIRHINHLLAELPADDPRRSSLYSERSFLRLQILNLRARRMRYR